MSPERYTYRYDPERPAALNGAASMEMDALRSELAPTSESLRRRVAAHRAARNGVPTMTSSNSSATLSP